MSETLELVLPTSRSVGREIDEVSKLVIVGHQGTGKTIACAQLPNSLIIDFEDGCKDHYEGQAINLKKYSAKKNITLLQAFGEVVTLIKKKNAEKGDFMYDYIVFDGLSALEKLTHVRATALFKDSIVGKGMLNKGAKINDVVTDVPESGW